MGGAMDVSERERDAAGSAAGPQRGGSGIPGERRKQRVSRADVAKLADVSPTTVSRVATGHSKVDNATREKVLAAMAQLDYRPNSAARALRYGQFNTIGVILTSLGAIGKNLTVEAIAADAAAEGYATMLIPIDVPTQDNVMGAFTRLGELAVDAVIVFIEVHLLDAGVANLPPNAHVVVVDSDAAGRYRVVDTDQIGGTRQAISHLLELGHHTVWHVAGPDSSYASQRRANTWRTVLEEAGRPVPPLIRGDWTAQSGYEAGLALTEKPNCTAVFTANDEMALGVLRAFHDRGVSVPADVSVVGFDDLPAASQFIPPLTTIHQDFAEVGRRSVREALRQIRDHHVATPGTSLVPTRLVIRSSTAPPPTGRSAPS